MCRHGLGIQVTERLSTSHMLIVIEKTQSTFAAIPSTMMIGGGVVNWDREPRNTSGISPSLH
jgi:hypothetical protein